MDVYMKFNQDLKYVGNDKNHLNSNHIILYPVENQISCSILTRMINLELIK